VVELRSVSAHLYGEDRFQPMEFEAGSRTRTRRYREYRRHRVPGRTIIVAMRVRRFVCAFLFLMLLSAPLTACSNAVKTSSAAVWTIRSRHLPARCAVMEDVTSTAPIVALGASASAMRFTRWQVRNLVAEANAHNGYLGSELDAFVPAPPARRRFPCCWSLVDAARRAARRVRAAVHGRSGLQARHDDRVSQHRRADVRGGYRARHGVRASDADGVRSRAVDCGAGRG